MGGRSELGEHSLEASNTGTGERNILCAAVNAGVGARNRNRLFAHRPEFPRQKRFIGAPLLPVRGLAWVCLRLPVAQTLQNFARRRANCCNFSC
jgi:hypothetical protein